MTQPVCVVPAGDWTGEGAVWSAAEGAIYWVDISRFVVHRFTPATGLQRSWLFEEPVTATGLTDRPDTMILAQSSKIILWQPETDTRTDLADPHGNFPAERFNDGRPDPAGYFWAGTMENNVGPGGEGLPLGDQPLGRLFRVAGDGSVETVKTGIGISNTFCWSPDATRFYTADTLANVISVWDYDVSTGTIANERPFFSGFDRGLPDGSVVDAEGFLWNARFSGGCVVRVAPDGTVDRILEMPVDDITTCTFGGPDLRTLFITTAGGGRGEAKGERLAGGLFAADVGVAGLAENRFRIGG